MRYPYILKIIVSYTDRIRNCGYSIHRSTGHESNREERCQCARQQVDGILPDVCGQLRKYPPAGHNIQLVRYAGLGVVHIKKIK